MNQTRIPNMTRRPSLIRRDDGYSLLELSMVLFMMSILAIAAIVRLSGSQNAAAMSVAQRIVSDVAYAQDMAKQSNSGTQIGFYYDSGGGGGCFVATACYGPESPHVAALRGMRDRLLRRYSPGRAFIRWYYRDGPMLARFVRGNPLLRQTAQIMILPVAILSLPFAGDAIAGGGGGGGGGGAQPNTYEIEFQDGTQIDNPQGGGPYVIDLGDRVTITSSNRTLLFDGSGKMSVDGYSWSNTQTSMVFCTLNDEINLVIARHSGKAWVQ